MMYIQSYNKIISVSINTHTKNPLLPKSMKQQRGSLLTEQSQVFLTEPLILTDRSSKQNQSSPSLLQNAQSQVQQPQQQKQRLISLDVLRGLTIVGMCMVDDLMDGPWWMEHPDWNGLTLADFIFPSFLFIMGMAVPLSLSQSKPFRLRNLLRIIGLFGIGVLLNLFDAKFNFTQFRIMGILQRLALCYGGLCFIHVITNYGDRRFRFVGMLFAVACGLIYVTFMITFENQECPHQKNLSKWCNFGAYWDRKIIGQKHMGAYYQNQPEGLFTTLTAFLNSYAGYWFCLTMFNHKNDAKTIVRLWLIAGTICGIIAIPLYWLMPFNKKLWSISYTFLTIGVSGVSLALITILVDMIGKNNPRYQKALGIIIAPSIWLGRNPLAIFVTRQFLDDLLNTYVVIDGIGAWEHMYHYLFETWVSVKEIASLMFSTMIMLVLILEAYVLYRNNIFIRL